MTRLAQDRYHGSEVPQLTEPSKKPPPQVVFSFPKRDYPSERRISRESLSYPKHLSCDIPSVSLAITTGNMPLNYQFIGMLNIK